jgi:hypothetical protein
MEWESKEVRGFSYYITVLAIMMIPFVIAYFTDSIKWMLAYGFFFLTFVLIVISTQLDNVTYISKQIDEILDKKGGQMDKRRFFSKLYIVLLTCLLILPCSKDVISADWIFIGKAENNGSWYYDAESINFLPNNIIRVWAKHIPNEAAARRFVYSLTLWEVICKDNTLNILAVMDYNYKDELIYSEKAPKPNPDYIVPASIGYVMQKTVCSLKDLKK